jgi:hypothetical protein
MKSLILSFLLIFGLTTINHGKPINDIYSLKDPVITEENCVTGIAVDTYEMVLISVPDSNGVLLVDKADVKDTPVDTGVNTDKNLSRMKMKTLEVTPASDQSLNAENMFYEKLSARLTEQYRNESATEDVPEAFDNSFCCYEFNVPRSVAILINAGGRETARQ